MSLNFDLPKIIAHRGLSSQAPENTAVAIEMAAKNGATWIEVDVNVSADGIPYLHHDDKINRCTNGNGYLIKTQSADLDKLDSGSWFSDKFKGETVLRFDAMMDLVKKHNLGVNVEIKPTVGWELPTTDIICDYIKRLWPAECPLIISSFSKLALLRARKNLPEHNLGLLVVAIPEDWSMIMDELQCQTFHCAWEFLDRSNVEAIHEKGYPILSYTVDDRGVAESLLEMGVDSLFSNVVMEGL